MRAGIETIGRDVRAQVIVRSTLAGSNVTTTPAAPRVIAESPDRTARPAD
jgi:hypothetical protein